jgi:adenosyl cobinamide kinase/adenosyl cobinamide phosphate guanylyltransferase
MILVVGGAASGKRAYIRSLGYAEADMADAALDARPVLCNLQALVFAAPETSGELLAALLEKEVVACDEVGSGVIPVSREEREAREATGRLCILLAQRAERVVRLVAGLPVVLKG